MTPVDPAECARALLWLPIVMFLAGAIVGGFIGAGLTLTHKGKK